METMLNLSAGVSKMDFLAGEALGALIFFAAFWLAVKYLEGRTYSAPREAIQKGALPVVHSNDAREAAIEEEAFRKAPVPDFPEGLGRV